MSVLSKPVNRRIGQAMHLYKMLQDGDRVIIAVSGGVDSLVLTWLLANWKKKAPINYELLAVHIDNGFGEPENRTSIKVGEQLERLSVPYLVEETDFGKKAQEAEDGKSTCYHCARQRRNRLFELAQEKDFSSIAFGHHKDDLLETFFLNLLYGGNLSTMVPRQDLFEGKMKIIRPMAFIDKIEVQEIAAALDLVPVKNPCPMDSDSKRQDVRSLLASLYDKNPSLKANIFSALSNVREGYLLKPYTMKQNPEKVINFHADSP